MTAAASTRGSGGGVIEEDGEADGTSTSRRIGYNTGADRRQVVASDSERVEAG